MKDKKKIFFAGALLIILVLSILIVALLTNNKTKEKIFYEDGNFKLYTQIDNLSSKEENHVPKRYSPLLSVKQPQR